MILKLASLALLILFPIDWFALLQLTEVRALFGRRQKRTPSHPLRAKVAILSCKWAAVAYGG
jgi:hypothetical protein